MSSILQHRWDVTPQRAREIQYELAGRVIAKDAFGPVNYVAGVDVGFEDNNRITRAAVVVLHYPQLEFCCQAIARRKTRFPYIPGYLSFREIPAVMAALEKIKQYPDLIICDGQGLAHPRRFGIACHLGVLTDMPTIGAAKSRLIGTHGAVPPQKGAWVDLLDDNERIGAVVRTRTNVRPLYVSVGHKVSLASAIEYVLACTTRYRLPETTRYADRLASQR